ncbi:MAG: DSD1 family PLP-dependent enzyme [Alphaproteobacteria bacterium]|nr:DSD1 family PLP-dependent enzyme [Alphaproteobacteria bacterium]
MTSELGPNQGLIGAKGSRIRLETPALVLDLDKLEHNIASLARHAKDHRYALRPVAKIHKSVEIARMQMAAGAIGQCCATLAEAEAMVAAEIPGVLLFTSVVSPAKVARVAALNARADGLLVAVDDAGNVDALAAAARKTGNRLKLLVDVEIGGGRTGLTGPDAIIALARRIAAADALEYAGLQAYDGSFQNTVDYDERRARAKAPLGALTALRQRLAAEGLAPAIVSGGGTGTHDFAGEDFTEVQAGTYIFLDVNYLDARLRRDDPSPFKPALFVRTAVISTAQPEFVVTDGGLKEFASVSLDPLIPSGPLAGAPYSLVGDDMGRIDIADPARRPRVGDAVECIPPHCYATLNLYSRYHCVRGDTLVAIWPIVARDNH